MKKDPVSITHPGLIEEWDFIKNVDIRPESVTYGSNKTVWWKCKKGHSWCSRICNRTMKSYGCPVCSNRRLAVENSLKVRDLELALEWDYTKNGKLTPDKVSKASNKAVWWKCSEGHSWKATVNNRHCKKQGCPYCAGKLPHDGYSLLNDFPSVAEEWDYERNNNLPEEYTPYSNAKVNWICSEGHRWKISINHRTRKIDPSGCPYCYGRLPTEENNLYIKYVELSKEYDCHKNKDDPRNIAPYSNKKVWWKCSNGHSWKAVVNSRTYGGTSCPYCSYGNVSTVSQQWLDSIESNSIIREHYFSELGYRVDGFDPSTNTVYEFFGDFWHGNPEVFDPDQVNPVNKKKFGKLYKETMYRLRCLEDNGFNVVYIWENDFNI